MSTIKNTEDEHLFDPNSPLSSANGKNPFRMDDSYFDSFSIRLTTAISDLEELKEEAPTLYSIPKYNPFEVPAGYFDELPMLVQELATFQQSHFSLKEWLLQLVKPNFAFPVAITVIIAITAIRFIDKQAEQPKTEVASEVSLEEQLYPIDENILVDLLDESEIESTHAASEEPITNYLIDNNIDETSLAVDLNTTEHENE
ncbi:MAG TPA: hypothetical protein VFF27_01650 [Bacteroidia bacterium]|jgi:hypothetical protein|nr:hypothetical protein [Bacteroidia bacterium]